MIIMKHLQSVNLQYKTEFSALTQLESDNNNGHKQFKPQKAKQQDPPPPQHTYTPQQFTKGFLTSKESQIDLLTMWTHHRK